jgi:hypothetical protein
MVKQLSIGFHISLDVTGMDQFKRLLDDETMPLKPISNHENRQNRSTRLHRQDGQPRGGRRLSPEKVNPYAFASLGSLID